MEKSTKSPIIYHEAKSIWSKITTDTRMKDIEIDLAIHKKLLQFFHVGDFYYYLFNLRRMDFDFISPEATNLLGYPKEQLTVPFYLSIIHPEDLPYFMAFERQVVDFFNPLPKDKIGKYKARYDIRLRKSSGEYIRILHQMIAIIPNNEGVQEQSLGVHTDITYLKSEGAPKLSFIGFDGEPSFVNVSQQTNLLPSRELLTSREKQIVHLLIEGKTSNQIADYLFISADTVKTHRKNILKKTNLKSTAELISNAIKKAWL